MNAKIARSLDLRGRPSAEVVASTREAVRHAEPGALIEVIATERDTLTDLPAWSKANAVELVESSQLGLVVRFVLRKPAGAIDEGMRRWYDACRCCMHDAHPDIVARLDAERVDAQRDLSGPGICEVAEDTVSAPPGSPPPR